MLAVSTPIHAPELAPGEWLNSSRPMRIEEWRGRAVLVAFWDFTCLNGLRTLPYLAAWHQASRDLPVSFLGIHSPEFAFARERGLVEAAVRRLGIKYPVLLDNDYANWDAYANRYWPTVYLIDARGYIRYQHSGEGAYDEIEHALSGLTAEAVRLAGQERTGHWPRLVGALRGEDKPGAMCFRTTPELHTGFQRGALGNPEGYLPRGLPLIYRLPAPDERQDGYFYAEGAWQASSESFATAGEQTALVLPYHAATANAVLSVSADPVELMLNLKPAAKIEVSQDGRPLDGVTAGSDVRFE